MPDALWARPDWTAVLERWGMADTGERPRSCALSECPNPHASGESICNTHIYERAAARRSSDISATTFKE